MPALPHEVNDWGSHRIRIKPAPNPSEVEIVHPSHQPSKAELEEDMRVSATFEKAVDALTRPVRIRYIDSPKPA